MKKILFLLVAFTGIVFAADGVSGQDMIRAYSVIGAGIGLGIAALGGAIGMGSTAASTISGTARNPGVGGKLTTTMFIAIAMIEAQVIYMLVVALLLLFANPFLG